MDQGLSFCLSLPLNYPGGRSLAPHRFPVLHSTQRHGKRYFNYAFRDEGGDWCDIGCDDFVTLSTQYSTQWDSFAHIGSRFDLDGDGEQELCFYNGYLADEDIRAPEDRKDDQAMPLAIDAFAATPIQGRGVMVDLEHHFGRDRRDVTLKELVHVLDADGIRIESGDILCLHTGFAAELLAMERAPDPARIHDMCCALNGHDHDLLEWISRSGVAAIAADNFAVERVGLRNGGCPQAYVPLHQHCLFKPGIPLGELWHLTDLAAWLRARGRSRFLLTAPPLRLPGAVGSPVTPVATV